jgi:hypothetical protein
LERFRSGNGCSIVGSEASTSVSSPYAIPSYISSLLVNIEQWELLF